MHRVIIVGSGAAATGAALQLAKRGIKSKVLDAGVGTLRNEIKIPDNLYKWKSEFDSFEFHIGSNLIGINELIHSKSIIPKLGAPNFAYITCQSDELSPAYTENFDVTQSFAFGGLANAWGAGMYRFVDRDMRGFPFGSSELDPYADQLTEHMGISGAEDDLVPHFGTPKHLLPPLRLSRNFSDLYEKYLAKRGRLNKDGVLIGRPRIAALSVPYNGRPAVQYDNTEFWQSSDSIYTPSITLNKLIGNGWIEYSSGWIVESFHEEEDCVKVRARCLKTNSLNYFNASKIILAAGAIGTTKIVLTSAKDCKTKLKLQDNPKLQIPLLIPRSIGNRLDIASFGLTQLNVVWHSNYHEETLQGSLMELTSPLRAEFYNHFPLSSVGRMVMIRKLLPSMILLQLFFPGHRYGVSEISLSPDGALMIKGVGEELGIAGMGDLLRALRKLGLWSHSSLMTIASKGNSLHYGCTLPMKESPGGYECHANGLLFGTKNIYIADSAAFSSLPAKNMSFGMMTNAMRVADSLIF